MRAKLSYQAALLRAVTAMALLGCGPALFAQTINIKEYFPLGSNSQWHYTGKGQPGSSVDDDFWWYVQTGNKAITNTLGSIQARQILTDTDDDGDARDGSIDYWYVNSADSKLYFCGTYFAQGATGVPAQDIILDDPLLIGGNGQAIGNVVNDTGHATIHTLLGDVTGTITSKITYHSIVARVTTPLGHFNNVLRLIVEIKATVNSIFGSQTFDLNTSEFFLSKNKGMIKQDQDSDLNDAEIQVIDAGKINGVTLQPDLKNAAVLWMLYE